MNKKELIERIEGLKNIFGNECEYVKIDFVIELISELDEPEKVIIPQFVADIIEGASEENPDSDLGDTLQYALINATIDFASWFDKKSNRELFARACILGYEVEKEKRYFVKAKGICEKNETLNCEKHSKEWLFSNSQENSLYKTKHTRKELEDAGFGWVFDCEGIEIEEVME